MTILVNPRAVDLDRLVKLLGMLGSAHEGERAAAGLKADQLVRSLNLTWQEIVLAKSITKPTSRLADIVESKLGTVLATPEPLTNWEKRFVASINGRQRLSLKQRNTLDRLYRKAAMAEGQAFLHWKAGRKCRVLYVDGEISRREMKRRLRDAARRVEAKPEGLCILSTEDYPDMPPLNTPKGQKWFDAFIEKHGPFDLIIFDNVQALLAGNMKEEEQWASILPWVRSLTRRSIGQIWFHHTGHDESKSYGSKAREWQMDTVILMERVEVPGADLAFTLKFTKARERSPENRQDFEPVTMSLKDDQWTHTRTPTPKTALGLKSACDVGPPSRCHA